MRSPREEEDQRHNGSRINDPERTHILISPEKGGESKTQDDGLDMANALRDVSYPHGSENKAGITSALHGRLE
jgi:hypothetical protein